MRASSPLSAGLRSALVPGWGQAALGGRRVAAILLVADVALVAAATWVALLPADHVFAALVRPGTFAWIVGANAGVLLLRGWATWDAWDRAPGRGTVLGIALLLAFVAVPHVAAGAAHARLTLAVDRVFAAPPASSSPPPTTLPPSTPSDGSPTTSAHPTTTDTTDISIETTTTAAAPAGPPWGDHLVLLLLGGDGGPDRDGIRTDAMLVVAVRSGDARTSVFSLPRNLRAFPFPDGDGFDDILNAVHGFGTAHPERFDGPDPGATALTGVVEEMLGIEVDHHVLVDFEAFRAGIDALGGVTVTVPRTITYPGFRRSDGTRADIVIEAGERHLDGDTALAYVRSREEGTDYGRMERQRCVLTALLDQADPTRAVLAAGSLLATFEQTVSTDIPRDALGDMVVLLAAVDTDDVGLITFGPPAWHAGWVQGGWPIPDVDRMQEAVAAALAGAAPMDAGLVPAGTACGS